MSTTPKAWMVTIHYGDGETGAASDVYAGTPEAAEQIAEERSRGFGFISRPIPLYGEHSQPLADELATVKAERDELRAALEKISRDTPDGLAYETARAILEKYPKP